MKITAPAVERVHVATRYRDDFILNEETFDVRVKRKEVIPLYAFRPTTVTIVDYDFQTAARLRATVSTAVWSATLIFGLVLVPASWAYAVGRDLVQSVIETTRRAASATLLFIGDVGAEIGTAARAIFNP